MEDNYFGKKLKNLRESNGFSQRTLADKLSIHFTQIARYESGKQMPTAKNKLKIAELFNVSVAQLLNNNSNVFTDKELDSELLELFKAVQNFDTETKQTIIDVIRAFKLQYNIDNI